MRANVAYYDSRDYDLGDGLADMHDAAGRFEASADISELIGVEATARRAYYQTFTTVLPKTFTFERLEYDPPPNPVNSLSLRRGPNRG